ncbi:hypothetical protein N7456_012876 [Penicillium angulare]|uniref:Utp8 beta-propeller domain-containing protein n=1 Tax=Penicillium angulare TaxID=116970 RepID=A0A9W9EKI7_9EURO|nr:hypothetical protein N7456_012876 [Penicillium angulare]
MDLQSPSILAQLPRPLHASTGKTRIGDVYSLADAKKRKRYEVSVAVDGEAINIYNVQTPKLVTSYAVPPQSIFSCRPCSVRRKISKKSLVQRQTYVAATKPEHQLKCFVEEISNGSSAPAISSSTTTITDSRSPTAFIGILPTGHDDEDEKDSFDVVTVHGDGRIRRLSADLKTQRWSIQHSEISKTSSTHTVQTCFLIDIEDARKALFKRRQDLAALALGDQMTDAASEPSILLVISHPKDAVSFALEDVNIQVFSVPTSSAAQEESQRLRHLQTIRVPGFKKINSNGLQWNFHPGSAGLQLSFDKGFFSIDMSQYAPSVTSQFTLDGNFSSVMRVSPQCIIGATDSLVAVYDTQYQSVQRSIALREILPTTDSNAPISFISYFAKLGIAVGTKGNALIAFDLTSLHSHSGPSLKRSRDGLLIDAIGRGIGASAGQWDVASKKHRSDNMTSSHLNSPERIERWNKLTETISQAIESKDADVFDRAVQTYFCPPGSPTTLPTLGEYVDPESTLFLLSKIFVVESSESKLDMTAPSSFHLRIVLWPRITCAWLINLGHLSPDNVEIALRRASKPHIIQPLPTGTFTQALIDSDPSMRRVNHVLGGSSAFTVNELSYALKYFLTQARDRSGALEETARAITNGDIATPTEELSRHLGSETATVKAIFKGLNTSLHKIHLHPLSSVTKSLRSNLARQELISMIHHLRLSLATGGYMSRFSENPPTPITIDMVTPPLSLKTITDLLTSAVDAVGPSGWISALPNVNDLDDETASTIAAATREMDLIADMRAEVSATLGGVEEATYLKGILREYLQFAEQVVASNTAGNVVAKVEEEPIDKPSHLIRHEKLNGADLLVYSRPGEGEDGVDGEASGKMLPLSMKAASTDVTRTKVKKSTGEAKVRSDREISYLRRKEAGKYSFEKLLI